MFSKYFNCFVNFQYDIFDLMFLVEVMVNFKESLKKLVMINESQ